MLRTIALILFVLWLLAWFGFHILGAAVHVLLILAIVFLVISLVRRV